MSEFAHALIEWQRRNGRHDLPWQQSRDPYRVWLSEIMLQQTQVDTVIPYYQRFLARFPDVASLAFAPVDDVLALWSGLGYYARARNLHAAARRVMEQHAGNFPRTAAELAELPGIGRSTAAAIASFCFGERVAILDGNVKRVLCRHFAIEGYPGERVVEQKLWALAESLLPERDMPIYPQAQMDLGAMICTRSKPRCLHCPVNHSCLARASGREDAFPTPRPRKALPERSCGVLILKYRGKVLVEQRPAKGIWGGLFSLPEMVDEESPQDCAVRRFGLDDLEFAEGDSLRHVFTHFGLTLTPWQATLRSIRALRVQVPNWRWVGLDELDELGLPAPIRKLLERALA